MAISPENQDRLAAALEKFGFSAKSVSDRPLLEASKFIRIGEQPIRVEIHGGITGVEFAECYRSAEICRIQGLDVPVIGLQDLRANKRAAGRTKDHADLESLPE